MAIVRLGNDVCGAGCASAGAIIVIGRFSEVTGRGKRLRPARRWKSWMPTFGPSGAKPNPLSRGTEGSNPALSRGESATNQCPAFGIPIGAIFLLRWSPPLRTDKAPIKEKTPAEEAGFSKIGDRSRGGRSPQCHRRIPLDTPEQVFRR